VSSCSWQDDPVQRGLYAGHCPSVSGRNSDTTPPNSPIDANSIKQAVQFRLKSSANINIPKIHELIPEKFNIPAAVDLTCVGNNSKVQ
ncbi:hypothetical protein TrispH2_012152, partial [Trichoplax sp. H2]